MHHNRHYTSGLFLHSIFAHDIHLYWTTNHIMHSGIDIRRRERQTESTTWQIPQRFLNQWRRPGVHKERVTRHYSPNKVIIVFVGGMLLVGGIWKLVPSPTEITLFDQNDQSNQRNQSIIAPPNVMQDKKATLRATNESLANGLDKPVARTCDLPDIESNSTDWNLKYQWIFSHTVKTMGTSIYAQLPADYKKKFYWMTSYRKYEEINQVNLRTLSMNYTKDDVACFDHLNVDLYVDLGILRCSDIGKLKVMAIIREPFEWFISHCSHFKRSIEEEIACLSGETCHGMYRQLYWFSFQYDWEMTIISKDRPDLISEWFAKYNIDMKFDETHRKGRSKLTKCRPEEITEEQRHMLNRIMAEEIELCAAVQRNNGTLQMSHHLHWRTY